MGLLDYDKAFGGGSILFKRLKLIIYEIINF